MRISSSRRRSGAASGRSAACLRNQIGGRRLDLETELRSEANAAQKAQRIVDKRLLAGETDDAGAEVVEAAGGVDSAAWPAAASARGAARALTV